MNISDYFHINIYERREVDTDFNDLVEIKRLKEIGDPLGKVEDGHLDANMNDYNGKPGSPRVASEPPNSSQADELSKQTGGRKYRRPGEYVTEDVIKLNEKVIVPVKEFPKVSFFF